MIFLSGVWSFLERVNSVAQAVFDTVDCWYRWEGSYLVSYLPLEQSTAVEALEIVKLIGDAAFILGLLIYIYYQFPKSKESAIGYTSISNIKK
jgi:hypothetical protein